MASYGDVSGFQAWLTANGHALPASPTPAVLIERGSAYINSAYGSRFSGQPTGGLEQDLAWPRTGATAYGSALASDLIPGRVVTATYMAAWQEASNPGSLSTGAVSASGIVKREKVDVIEVEYAVGDGSRSVAEVNRVVIPAIEGLLAPLLGPDMTGFVEPMVLVV